MVPHTAAVYTGTYRMTGFITLFGPIAALVAFIMILAGRHGVAETKGVV